MVNISVKPKNVSFAATNLNVTQHFATIAHFKASYKWLRTKERKSSFVEDKSASEQDLVSRKKIVFIFSDSLRRERGLQLNTNLSSNNTIIYKTLPGEAFQELKYSGTPL